MKKKVMLGCCVKTQPVCWNLGHVEQNVEYLWRWTKTLFSQGLMNLMKIVCSICSMWNNVLSNPYFFRLSGQCLESVCFFLCFLFLFDLLRTCTFAVSCWTYKYWVDISELYCALFHWDWHKVIIYLYFITSCSINILKIKNNIIK